VLLSVVVRWGPVGSAVNGTLVARPARTTFVQPFTVDTTLTQGESSVSHYFVGKPRPAARQLVLQPHLSWGRVPARRPGMGR